MIEHASFCEHTNRSILIFTYFCGHSNILPIGTKLSLVSTLNSKCMKRFYSDDICRNKNFKNVKGPLYEIQRANHCMWLRILICYENDVKTENQSNENVSSNGANSKNSIHHSINNSTSVDNRTRSSSRRNKDGRGNVFNTSSTLFRKLFNISKKGSISCRKIGIGTT